MTHPSRNFLLFGQREPPAEPVALRAGPLSGIFDAGDLRYITLGEREVIRRIYAAVRDWNWGTVSGKISNLHSQIAADNFRITYDREHKQGDIHFIWRAEITGDTHGTVCFTFDGEAKTTFLRNRIGFCVLHPIRECAGARCRADYADGTSKELRFPGVIAAEQPVKGLHDLAGMAHEIEPGAWAELTFEGDTFETEDQRNWIDASFKTFCTPLRIPYPVEIKAGARVMQEVRLKIVDRRLKIGTPAFCAPVSDQRSPINDLQSRAVSIKLREELRRLPSLGLGTSSNKSPENFPNKTRLEALHLSHLRHDVDLESANWSHDLLCASMEATTLRLPLELAVHLPQERTDQLGALSAWLTETRSRFPKLRALARILVFGLGTPHCSSGQALCLARKHLGGLGVPIGAGTSADLYQLNLSQPPTDADFICWSMTPQVHAFDNASIAETPEAAAQQVTSVRSYFPGKPLVVSPVTLKPRFNPVAAGPEPVVPPGELPPSVDPRQMSLFGAAWTLAMLNALAEGGADSVTFFETTGWRGVMETQTGSPGPDQFPSTPGQVFPVYHVFAALSGFVDGGVVACESSEPRDLAVLMLRKDDRARLCLGNFTGRELMVSLPVDVGEVRTLRRLNEHTAAAALAEPEEFWREDGGSTPRVPASQLTLEPCELVFLDFGPPV